MSGPAEDCDRVYQNLALSAANRCIRGESGAEVPPAASPERLVSATVVRPYYSKPPRHMPRRYRPFLRRHSHDPARARYTRTTRITRN